MDDGKIADVIPRLGLRGLERRGPGIGAKRFLGGHRRALYAEVLICKCSHRGVQALHVIREGAELEATQFGWPADANVASGIKTVGRRCPIFVLLPKSQYLQRVLELPTAQPHEVPMMLALELEANVPPEYGPFEYSFRRLEPADTGYQRFEVYITRVKNVAQQVSKLTALGIRPRGLLPSTLVWTQLLQEGRNERLLVASTDREHLELASMDSDGALSTKTIETSLRLDNEITSQRQLIDHLRFMLTRKVSSDQPLMVGWIGPRCPHDLANDRIVISDINDQLILKHTVSRSSAGDDDPLLHMAGRFLLGLTDHAVIETGSIFPRDLALAQSRRTMYRDAIAAIGLFLATLLFVFAALRISTIRHRSFIDVLAAKVALFKNEGQAVGTRKTQLQVVAAARSTRNDFKNILAGLYDATPRGISYTHVELVDQGAVLLRGQATSLALPFALLERLESQAVFQQVNLRDATQSNRQGKSITEFRIDCRLRRRIGP